MKEKILQVIFDGWCDGKFGVDREAGQMTAGVIADIGEHFHAAKADQNYIDTQAVFHDKDLGLGKIWVQSPQKASWYGKALAEKSPQPS